MFQIGLQFDFFYPAKIRKIRVQIKGIIYMQPKLQLLSLELVSRILDEAFQLLVRPGIKVQSSEARQLLAQAGAQVDESSQVAHIPERLVRQALETVPSHFDLHDRSGHPAVHYGGDLVTFDPGSSGVHILDPETLQHRPRKPPTWRGW